MSALMTWGPWALYLGAVVLWCGRWRRHERRGGGPMLDRELYGKDGRAAGALADFIVYDGEQRGIIDR